MTVKLTLKQIDFPVFKLGDKPSEDGGVTYYMYGMDTKYSDAQYKVKVVDDKNIEEDSLALRRLRLKDMGYTLQPLNKAIFFISDLIKLATPKTYFIDKSGQVFNYEKKEKVPLVFRPISKVMPLKHGGAVIEVKGIPARFKVLKSPEPHETFAGLLAIGTSYILYGLYDQQYDTTNRDI